MKRTFALIMAVMLLCAFTFVPVKSQAGTSGNFDFEILDNGTVRITKYTGSVSDLSIPDRLDGYTVSELARQSFAKCNALVSITIPNTVTEIGSYAFEQCEKLESVTLPDSIDTVGYGEFLGCKKLNKVNIPNSVKIIETYAFHGCSSLKNISIPESIIIIERNAFDNTGLTEVSIPPSVVSIGLQAFYACKNLENVTLSNNLKVIYNGAFYSCDKLKSIYIPESVEYIDDTAVGYIVDNKGQPIINDDFIIYGKIGSQAEVYAKDNGIMFEERIDTTEPTEATFDPTKTTDRDIFGDIDGDRDITVVDSTFLQRYTIKADTPYPIGEKIKD